MPDPQKLPLIIGRAIPIAIPSYWQRIWPNTQEFIDHIKGKGRLPDENEILFHRLCPPFHKRRRRHTRHLLKRPVKGCFIGKPTLQPDGENAVMAVLFILEPPFGGLHAVGIYKIRITGVHALIEHLGEMVGRDVEPGGQIGYL